MYCVVDVIRVPHNQLELLVEVYGLVLGPQKQRLDGGDMIHIYIVLFFYII